MNEIKLNRQFRVPSDVYQSVVDGSKNGTNCGKMAEMLGISYSTVSRIRAHARKSGILGITETHEKMLKTRKLRKREKNLRQRREMKKMVNATNTTPTPTPAQTATERTVNKDQNATEFIKVDFKGTEIHVEKSGKIFITAEGIVIK